MLATKILLVLTPAFINSWMIANKIALSPKVSVPYHPVIRISSEPTLTVDLEAQEVRTEAATYGFEIDPHRRHCLLEGLDDIGLSLQYAEQIREYERQRRSAAPWLFDALR